MIALSTGSLYTYGIARVFAMAARAGYDGVEIIIDGRKDSYDPTYLQGLSSDYRLPIVALHSPFVPDIQDWPHDQLGRLKQTVKVAEALSAPLVVTHLPRRIFSVLGRLDFLGHRRFLLPIPGLRKGSFYQFIDDGRLQEMESSSGIIIALENMPSHRFLGFKSNGYWFNSPKELARFPHITLDTTHLATWGLDPEDVYSALKKNIVHIHLSNFDGREHRSPPDGHLPLESFLRRLARDRYSGVVSVEAAPDAIEADDERKCQVALERALAFCRQHFVASGP